MLEKSLFKITSIIMLGFCHLNNVYSQNLVPNPSFENNTACPSGPSQFNLCINWDSPNISEIDYFNICSTNLLFSIPNQDIYNYQKARSGNAFTGLLFSSFGSNYREYIRSQFFSTLNSLECYYVEFYINSGSSTFGGNYLVNNIACLFTSLPINSTGTGSVLNIEPNVKKFKNPIIIDTLNWVKISGIYKANGGENFITIGNFNFDNETDTIQCFGANFSGAYYFIDDVSVIAVSDLPNSMPAFAGNDTIVAPGDSIFIGQEIANLNCTWRKLDGTFLADSTSGIWVQPTEETTYVVEQNLCGTITFDTVVVSVGYVGLSPLAEALEANGVTIYPNPNSGTFYLQTASNAEIKVYDTQGREIEFKKETIANDIVSLALNVINGLYNVQIIHSNYAENVKVQVLK